ncbi:MAG: polysaccharide deacetylase family protein [Clostridia bacterium]|nr:polysaccharide deacetylase family protein [Clostridia bacterium]
MERRIRLAGLLCLAAALLLSGCAKNPKTVQPLPETAAAEPVQVLPAQQSEAEEYTDSEQPSSKQEQPEVPVLPPMEPAEQIRMLGVPVQLQTDGETRFVPVKIGDAPRDKVAELLELERGETEAGVMYYAKRISVGDVPEGVKVPILMYHAVSDDCWGYSDLFVSPAKLEEQLAWMTENGYDAIWMEDLCHLEDYDKPVVLTFDDGYDDNYTELFPLLQKYNVKATIFVIAGSLGQPHKMTAEQVTELSQSGLISIQSHSMTHPYLNSLTQEQLEWELGESQRIIASLTGKIPNVLCYPSGGFNQLTIDVAKQYYDYGMRMAGYLYNTSVDPFRIQRFYISRQSPLSDFQYYIKQTDQ